MYIQNNDTWKKHSNPWSGWTRVAATPFLYHALWLRNPYYLVAVTIFLAINPRLFSAPKKTTNWMSKGVIGEKIYTSALITKDFISTTLCILMALSSSILIYAVWTHDLLLSVLLFVLSMTFKFWYLDRMVFLYEESRGRTVYEHRIN